MEPTELRKLGFSQTEAVLYLSLMRLGSAGVKKIVEETGFYKANVYDSLERMCERGIISKVIEINKRVYQLQNPNSLIELVHKKKFEVEQQEKLAKQLAKEVNLSKKSTLNPETAMVLRGIEGVKQIYTEIIVGKLDYLTFGSPKESDDTIGSHYWHNVHIKLKKNKIKARMIFHKSLRYWEKFIPKDVVKLRFFDERLEPLTETTIYGTKVAFVVWTEKPIITIVNNIHVANTYRQMFEMLWKASKP